MKQLDNVLPMSKDQTQLIVQDVWMEKYRYGDEQNPAASLRRVVKGVYELDPRREEFEEEAYQFMVQRKWSPGGRIHAGAGTDKKVTLLSCFVCSIIQDSMATNKDWEGQGIMDSLREAALTQQMGGGIGMDFSPVRPNGALVKRTGSVSTGVLPFMDMWHSMCATIMSSGSRRGAMMATLADDHPDVLDYVVAKQEPGRLTNFNVSILVSDELMKAVEEDSSWNLGFTVPRADGNHTVTSKNENPWYIYNTLGARDFWDLIIRNTYEYAEPGVVFIDRVNQMNNLAYCENIRCTNPCGEQPLPPSGACNLGALNLATMVDEPFTDKATFNFTVLGRTTKMAVRFLDNVLDISQYALEEQQVEAKNKRRLGIGVMGLGNMLQMVRLRYGSQEALDLVAKVFRSLRDVAYDASANLAEERGAFPLWDAKAWAQTPMCQSLPKGLQAKAVSKGLRNGVLMTIAPTGTTAIYYGNVSSGIEPTFAWKYKRRVRQTDGSFDEYEVEDYGYQKFAEVMGEKDPSLLGNLPDYMETATELSVDDHLNMQAVSQAFVDASISKTINCPESMPFDKFKEVYTQAYNLGCKGCTTYRPSQTRGSVMWVENDDSQPLQTPTNSSLALVPVVEKPSRPEELKGTTYKVKWPPTNVNYYITINDLEREDGERRPFEIFINTKAVENQEWVAGLTRVISSVFRRGGNIDYLPAELEQVYCPMGGAWVEGEYVPSLVAMIGRTITTHYEYIGIVKKKERVAYPEDADICPKCQAKARIAESGCTRCLACGDNNCG